MKFSSSPTTLRGVTSATLIILLVVLDQCVKYYIKTHFALYESHEVTSWFRIFFTENTGMAFGMQFVGTIVLSTFRFVAITFFLYVLAVAVRRRAPFGLIVCVSLIIAGAMGNLIDNFFYGLLFSESTPWEVADVVPFGQGYGSFLSGKVVDMFYFPLFVWPDWLPLVGGDVFFGAVFNLADAAISVGFVAALLFYYKRLGRSFLSV